MADAQRDFTDLTIFGFPGWEAARMEPWPDGSWRQTLRLTSAPQARRLLEAGSPAALWDAMAAAIIAIDALLHGDRPRRWINGEGRVVAYEPEAPARPRPATIQQPPPPPPSGAAAQLDLF